MASAASRALFAPSASQQQSSSSFAAGGGGRVVASALARPRRAAPGAGGASVTVTRSSAAPPRGADIWYNKFAPTASPPLTVKICGVTHPEDALLVSGSRRRGGALLCGPLLLTPPFIYARTTLLQRRYPGAIRLQRPSAPLARPPGPSLSLSLPTPPASLPRCRLPLGHGVPPAVSSLGLARALPDRSPFPPSFSPLSRPFLRHCPCGSRAMPLSALRPLPPPSLLSAVMAVVGGSSWWCLVLLTSGLVDD